MTTRRVTRTTVLPGSPESAWNAVMSPDVAQKIDPAVKEWTPDSEPIDVGTRFTIRGVSEAVQWEPPNVAAFVSVQGSRPLRVVATHRFETSGTGTRYTWSMDFDGPRLLVTLAARLFGRAIERQQRTLSEYLDHSK